MLKMQFAIFIATCVIAQLPQVFGRFPARSGEKMGPTEVKNYHQFLIYYNQMIFDFEEDAIPEAEKIQKEVDRLEKSLKSALFSDDLIQKLGYLNEDVSSAKLTLKHFKSLKDTLEEMRVENYDRQTQRVMIQAFDTAMELKKDMRDKLEMVNRYLRVFRSGKHCPLDDDLEWSYAVKLFDRIKDTEEEWKPTFNSSEDEDFCHLDLYIRTFEIASAGLDSIRKLHFYDKTPSSQLKSIDDDQENVETILDTLRVLRLELRKVNPDIPVSRQEIQKVVNLTQNFLIHHTTDAMMMNVTALKKNADEHLKVLDSLKNPNQANRDMNSGTIEKSEVSKKTRSHSMSRKVPKSTEDIEIPIESENSGQLSGMDDFLIVAIVAISFGLAVILVWFCKRMETRRNRRTKFGPAYLDNTTEIRNYAEGDEDENEEELLSGAEFFRMEPPQNFEDQTASGIDLRNIVRISSSSNTVGYQTVPEVDV